MSYIIQYLTIVTNYLTVPRSNNADPCGNEQPSALNESSSGTFTSPNYPASYFHNSDCSWLITVDDLHIIKLTFLDFSVEATTGCS